MTTEPHRKGMAGTRWPAGVQLASSAGAAWIRSASSLPPLGKVSAAMLAATTEKELNTA